MNHGISIAAAFVVALGSTSTPASAWTYQTVYAFTGGADGSWPGRVIADTVGNVYGTTGAGGAAGGGVAYKLSQVGQETVLGSFPTINAFPSPLVLDARGNLDGVAGLMPNGQDQTLYQISPSGKPRIVYAFSSIHDEGLGLTSDAKGNLYGVSYASGTYNSGTVYKITPGGVLSVLHSFGAPGDGLGPSSTLLLDRKGNIYGTTIQIVPSSSGRGTVFKLTPDGTETILHVFSGGHADGDSPSGNLVMDAEGDLFGTTKLGGGANGTVFEVTPDGQERILSRFSNGIQPQGLTIDSEGNLYGVAGSVAGCIMPGSIYEITTAGIYQNIYNSPGVSQHLVADQLAWSNGALYGETSNCGTPMLDFGTVYKLSP